MCMHPGNCHLVIESCFFPHSQAKWVLSYTFLSYWLIASTVWFLYDNGMRCFLGSKEKMASIASCVVHKALNKLCCH